MYDQHEKAHCRHTDSSYPHNCPHCPRHGNGNARQIRPGEQLQGQYSEGGRAQWPHHRSQRCKLHCDFQQPRHGSGGTGADLLGCHCQSGGDRRDHRLQQRWRTWDRNTDGWLRSPRCAGSPRQRGQRQPDGQSGDTAGDDLAHQPDPKGQRSVGTAGQRGPNECRPSLLRPALHMASRPGGKPSRC